MTQFGVSARFLLLASGQLISNIGSRLSSFALGLWVLQTTGSTTEFAVTFIVRAIPAIFFSSFAGALVDRWDRRRIMLGCDAAAAGLTILLAALLTTGHLAVWHIYAMVGLTSLLDCFREPTFASSVPLITPSRLLPRANAIVKIGEAAGMIVGPLLAGILVSTLDFQGVLLIDALTFAFGALTLILITIPPTPSAEKRVEPGLVHEALAGWRYLRQQPGLFGLVGVYGVNHFVFAVASVLIAPLLLSFSTPDMVGLQYGISGCGLLLGGVIMTISGGPKRRVNGVLLFSTLGGLFLAAHGLSPSFALVAIFGFILFLMLPVIDASSASLLQSKVPSHLQGRCFAVQGVLLNAATAAGYAVAGPLSAQVFEPLLGTGGRLATTIGSIIGTGPGRGDGLIFILLGTVMSAVALRAYSVPAIRNIDELADAFAGAEDTAPVGGAVP
jgi:MFS transporter, DHA3 family, macrolide efflux protein